MQEQDQDQDFQYEQQSIQEYQPYVGTLVGNDDQIVPGHGAGKIIDFNTADDDTFDMINGRIQDGQAQEPDGDDVIVMKVQNIPQSQRTYAEQLVPYYGENIPCLMYSAKWKQRETGVQEFTNGFAEAFLKCNTSEDPLETSQGAGLTKEQRYNLAIILNMTEVLKDKFQ